MNAGKQSVRTDAWVLYPAACFELLKLLLVV